ncbi:MAG: 6-carboxytetrahydropterin synthase [Planctomycetes bacterium]|nr:6-carboxytetrahydropterin synthase [Planctomycetota bacterium]
MFEVSVETSFTATHAVTICGVEEEPHSHDWKVVVKVQGEELDNDGLIVDFLDLEKQLSNAIRPLHDSNLNTCPEMNNLNPSTERVALYIAQCIHIPPPNKIVSVTVTEAPHCKATYTP